MARARRGRGGAASRPGTRPVLKAGMIKTPGSPFKLFRAVASHATAKKAGAASPFSITIRFRGGLNATQEKAFKAAAKRWTKVIVGDLPAVSVQGEVIDDVLIEAEGTAIDGPGHILGQAGPTVLRPTNAGKAKFLPAKGIMSFDTADLAKMQKNGTLNDVITHEMGHVLGIGSAIWTRKKLLKGAGTQNPSFHGKATMAEYGKLKGTGPTAVPVENTGGEGTRDSHWRESVFVNELMTGFVGNAGNPLSRLTAASLKDLGYVVDLKKAEKYALPSLMALAEKGALTAHAAPINQGMMLPSIPVVLPKTSLQ
jgi:hypothetical protein